MKPHGNPAGCSILDAAVLAELDAVQRAPLETDVAPAAGDEALRARRLRWLVARGLRGLPRWRRRTGLAALRALRTTYDARWR